jgi:hypothetical protein
LTEAVNGDLDARLSVKRYTGEYKLNSPRGRHRFAMRQVVRGRRRGTTHAELSNKRTFTPEVSISEAGE